MPPNEESPCHCHTMEEHQACAAPCLNHPSFRRVCPWPMPPNDAQGSPAWWAAIALYWPDLKTVEIPAGRPEPKEPAA